MSTPKNDEIHSNISSATAEELFDYFVGLALKRLNLVKFHGKFKGNL